jgi:hypothetical protein
MGPWYGPYGGGMMVCRRGIVAQVGIPPALKFICVARDDIQAHSQAAVEIMTKKRRKIAEM